MTLPLRLRPAVGYRIAALPLSFARDWDASGARPEWSTRARLLDAIRPSILRALTAERADAYMTILAEMLALRRTGTLAATLDDLRGRRSDEALDETAFLRDLLQLEEWGCLTRELAPQSIRGYRDARRERFKHRLTEDVVALLEWLEARLVRGGLPLRVDADDRLLDVLDRVRELARLTDGNMAPSIDGDHCWSGPQSGPDTIVSARLAGHSGSDHARRALHVVRSIDAELDTIARSLVSLHAEMRRFAGRTFDSRALERVVTGLEAYVAGFLRNVGQRRRELGEAIAGLAAPEVCERLRALARTDAEGASPFCGGQDTHPDSSTTRWAAFFEDGGRLDDHCARIEAATHEVIAKMRDRMAALERRGDRGHERACAIRALAAISARVDDPREGTLAPWGFGTPTWAPGDGSRLVPPLPRRKTPPRVEEPRPLPIKRASREVIREPRQARVRRIVDWLRDAGLAEGTVRLSAARHEALRGTEAPATWMAVARARHLGRSKGLSELGVHIAPTAGVVTVGNDTVGLASPDCIVSSVDLGQVRRS